MNEADLYSYNKRQEQRGNADENIKIMKNKLKIIKRRCNINQKKLETMKNFVKECENDYHRLMAMKVQMSMKVKVDFMKKEFYNINVKDKIISLLNIRSKNNNNLIYIFFIRIYIVYS